MGLTSRIAHQERARYCESGGRGETSPSASLSWREPTDVIISVLIAVSYIILVLLLPSVPVNRYALALLGLWLFSASLIHYAALRSEPALGRIRWIPLRFTGDLGRFQLRPRGDGRRVEVRAGSQVVAEAIANADGDQLLVDFDAASDSELEAFGTAIGQAIEMVVAADGDCPDGQRHRPARWGERTR